MIKNFFKIIDLISPKITLYYEGNKRFPTSIGGFFTIIIFFVGIFCFINQLLSLLNRDINGITYYRKYIDNLGSFEFNNNKDSFFIFANFINYEMKSEFIDLSKIRLIATFSGSTRVNESSFF